jgi:hypothetical protein
MKNELVAATHDTAQWQRSFESAFEHEKNAFRQLPPELLAVHKGQFVALSDGKIIDQDWDEIALAKRVSQMPRDKFVLIKHVVD